MAFAVRPNAFCEPCYCDRCDGAAKLLGEPCEFCSEPQWGCRNMLCPCVLSGWMPRMSARMDENGECVWAPRLCVCGQERMDSAQELCSDCWLTDYRKKYRGASGIQALWRGYKERQTIKAKNAEEVLRYTPIWRSYDDQYRMYVFCQTLMAELKKDDPSWDATQEPYYIWMLENGPILEEWETFLRRRGWTRPKKQGHLNTAVFKRLIHGVLDSCGVSMGARKATLALYNTFMRTH